MNASYVPAALIRQQVPKKLAQTNDFIYATYANLTASDISLLSAGLDDQKPCTNAAAVSDSTPAISELEHPIDPNLITLAIDSERQKGFTLLRAGPVALLTIDQGSKLQASEFLLQHAFHTNQIVPRNSSIDLYMVFPRSVASKLASQGKSALYLLARKLPVPGDNNDSKDSAATFSVCQDVAARQ